MFAKFTHCKFTDCAYSHNVDKHTTRIDELEREAVEMKEKFEHICRDCEELKLQGTKIQSRKDVKDREKKRDIEVSQLNRSLANMSRICEDLKLEVSIIKQGKVNEDHTMNDLESDILLQCKECEYNCASYIQMKKHTNTKHNRSVKCDKCDEKFSSNETLNKHLNESHNDVSQMTDVPECSLCDDKFSTNEDYEEHVNAHLEEINDIDTEDLTNGHEIFVCSLCDFTSGEAVTIKNHLREHAVQSKKVTPR
jgi:uncharacterized C2H2 Zn-finger protein